MAMMQIFGFAITGDLITRIVRIFPIRENVQVIAADGKQISAIPHLKDNPVTTLTIWRMNV
jgi:hypothetical protein